MRRPILVVMTAILVLALVTAAMAADPFEGTWKLNLAKSKYNPGPAFLKSSIFNVEARDNGQKCVYDEVDTDGKATHGQYAAKYDGKDYSVVGEPYFDAISVRRSDANTLNFLWKKGGNVGLSEHAVVSKNNKIWTDTLKWKDAKGQEFTAVLIYDKIR
jgi:hypothetical protein